MALQLDLDDNADNIDDLLLSLRLGREFDDVDSAETSTLGPSGALLDAREWTVYLGSPSGPTARR